MGWRAALLPPKPLPVARPVPHRPARGAWWCSYPPPVHPFRTLLLSAVQRQLLALLLSTLRWRLQPSAAQASLQTMSLMQWTPQVATSDGDQSQRLQQPPPSALQPRAIFSMGQRPMTQRSTTPSSSPPSEAGSDCDAALSQPKVVERKDGGDGIWQQLSAKFRTAPTDAGSARRERSESSYEGSAEPLGEAAQPGPSSTPSRASTSLSSHSSASAASVMGVAPTSEELDEVSCVLQAAASLPEAFRIRKDVFVGRLAVLLDERAWPDKEVSAICRDLHTSWYKSTPSDVILAQLRKHLLRRHRVIEPAEQLFNDLSKQCAALEKRDSANNAWKKVIRSSNPWPCSPHHTHCSHSLLRRCSHSPPCRRGVGCRSKATSVGARSCTTSQSD